MAVRRERVILDVTDNATAKFTKVAAGARVLGNELDRLGGKAVGAGEGMDGLGDETKGVGEKTETTTKKTKQYSLEMAVAEEKAARFKKALREQARAQLDAADGLTKANESAREGVREIDRYSGRLRTMLDLGVTLGPALIPLGASIIPVLTSSLVGLGAAAGGIGTAALAFNGIGDALKAAQDYDVERTAENFMAMRIEFEKIGPSGAHFVRYLQSLGPELQRLQFIARDGLLPGVEDGIDGLMQRLPQVQLIVADLAEGMGALARDAGESLGGPEWDKFFAYIQSDARPTLEAFARSIGNVGLGLANMLVEFAPATRDFTGGLESMTKRFADWSAQLEDDQSFQDFVDTIRRMGPEAVEFAGAFAQAVAGLVQAAAPVGSAVLPVLTQLAKVFAAVASSPIGPPLYTAAAGLLAFNRASKITTGLVDSLAGGFTNLGIQAVTTKDKLALIGTGGAAAALGIGTFIDTLSLMDSMGRSGDTVEAQVKSFQDLSDTLANSNVGKNASDLGINIGRLTQDLAENGAQGEYAKRVLDQLAGSSNGAKAAITGVASDALPFFTSESSKAFDAQKDLREIISKLGGAALGAESGFSGIIDTFTEAASAAQDLSGALAELNGWFDKRDAVIAYKDSLDTLAKGFKDGFKRDDLSALNDAGRSIIQVAEKLKGQKRVNFLEDASASLAKIGRKSGPEAQAAIEKVIQKFRDKGLLNPPKPKLEVDDKATPTLQDLGIKLRRFGGESATAKANVDSGNSLGLLGTIRSALANLNGTTATTYVRTIRQEFVNPQNRATGGMVFGPGGPRDDRVPAMLSNREFVQPVAAVDKYGVDFMESVRTLRFAAGGTPDKSAGKAGGGRRHDSFLVFFDGMEDAGRGLKGLKAALDKATEAQKKQLDAARSVRDEAIARRDALSSGIQGGLAADPWADREGSGNVWASGATAGGKATPQSALMALQDSTARARRLVAALNELKRKGITGPVLAEIIGTGDVERAEMMAALDVGTLTQFSSAFTENQTELAAAGLAGGNAVEAANIDSANKALREQAKAFHELQKDVRGVEKAIRESDKNNQRGHRENAKDVGSEINGAASSGRRRGGRGGRRR